MIFADRTEAGRKLAKLLKSKLNRGDYVVLSLLRGGAIIGEEVAKELSAKHLPLIVAKIAAPLNPELAIGAICQDAVYWDRKIISGLGLSQAELKAQFRAAREKQKSYVARFAIDELVYQTALFRQKVIVVDDGIATGATMKATVMFVQKKMPESLYVAVPVMSELFALKQADHIFVLEKTHDTESISESYREFAPVEGEIIKRIFGN